FRGARRTRRRRPSAGSATVCPARLRVELLRNTHGEDRRATGGGRRSTAAACAPCALCRATRIPWGRRVPARRGGGLDAGPRRELGTARARRISRRNAYLVACPAHRRWFQARLAPRAAAGDPRSRRNPDPTSQGVAAAPRMD